MHTASVAVVLICMVAGRANAQAVSFPADADMRAMQAPADWDGSRAQRVQGEDAPVAAAPVAREAIAPLGPVATSPDTARADFAVEVWDDHDRLVETMARCSDLMIGRAAFKVAAKERQGLKVTLRQGTTVVATKDAGQIASR